MIKINLINDATLYQWDTKRKLKISGKANIEEVHFSTLTSNNALVVTPKDNIVNIPSVLLQTGEDILVYLVEVDGDSKQIVAYKELNVCPRAKPDDYVYTEDEVFSYDKLENRLGLLEKDVIKDIQIDNKSIVNEEKIVNIPVAADGALGVVKTGSFGIKADEDGALMVDAANKTDINEKNQYKPITANNLEYAVQMGLISNEENLRLNEQEKEIVKNKLGTVGFSNELHGEVFNDYENNTATGEYSHAEGVGTNASSSYQHVQGKWNAPDTENKYAHIVGNGDSDNNRSNAHTVDWDGNAWFAGAIKVGGTSQDDINAVEVALKSDLSNLNLNSKAIIDVVSLPEINIDENVFYRLLKGNLVLNQFVYNTYKTHCVDGLPEEGLPATNIDNAEGNVYYNIQDNELYGYVDDILSTGLGVPKGWYTASILLGALGVEYKGVIADILEDPRDGAFRFLLENVLYTYKDNKWNSMEIIGRAGDGNSAEIFNHPSNIASGHASHAEGFGTNASGDESHAEGSETAASGFASHAEGQSTTASGTNSHAEGNYAIASKWASHAEGYSTNASGTTSHAEGYATVASGMASHTEGYETEASGDSSHAEGYGTKASSSCQHVQGRYNIEDTENKYAHIIGNGEYNSRSNAHTLDWNGNAWFAGKVTVGPDNKELATKDDIATGGGKDEVYVGSGEMPEGYILQIDPTGESSGIVEDVKINDTSIVENNVANIPIANLDVAGVGKVNQYYGVTVLGHDNIFRIISSKENEIDIRGQDFKPIVPKNLDYAVKAALTDGKGQAYTSDEKASARDRLGLEWRYIGKLETAEDVQSMSISLDSEGKPFNLRKVRIVFKNMPNQIDSATQVKIFINNGAWQQDWFSRGVKLTENYRVADIELEKICDHLRVNTLYGTKNAKSTSDTFTTLYDANAYWYSRSKFEDFINEIQLLGASVNIGANSIMEVWGVDA